ncbi:hypothetical protein ACOSQ4_021621 [Xanthoceras sorbifolium]
MVIENLWNPIGRVEVEAVGENLFVFHFRCVEERPLVWARGPWYFNGSLIILEKPSGPGDLSRMEFRFVDFWVQIYNIPIMCMNKRFAKLLAERIGMIVEIPAKPKDCRGKFLKVRVGIDVMKPLKRGLKVKLEDLLVAAPIKYERLLEFCFACGLLGHALRDCDDETAMREALDGSSTKFGSWLRAAPPERVRPNFQRSGGQDKAKMENDGASSDNGRGMGLGHMVVLYGVSQGKACSKDQSLVTCVPLLEGIRGGIISLEVRQGCRSRRMLQGWGQGVC